MSRPSTDPDLHHNHSDARGGRALRMRLRLRRLSYLKSMRRRDQQGAHIMPQEDVQQDVHGPYLIPVRQWDSVEVSARIRVRHPHPPVPCSPDPCIPSQRFDG